MEKKNGFVEKEITFYILKAALSVCIKWGVYIMKYKSVFIQIYDTEGLLRSWTPKQGWSMGHCDNYKAQ